MLCRDRFALLLVGFWMALAVFTVRSPLEMRLASQDQPQGVVQNQVNPSPFSIASLPDPAVRWTEPQEALESEDGEDDALAFRALDAPSANEAPPSPADPWSGPSPF